MENITIKDVIENKVLKRKISYVIQAIKFNHGNAESVNPQKKLKNVKRLLLLLLTLAICDYAGAQYILAGDSTAPDILHKALDKTVHVNGAPGGISYSDENNFMLDLNNDGSDDLVFTVYAWGAHGGEGSECSVTTLNNNLIRVTSLPFLNDSTSFVDTLNYHDTIEAKNFWYTSSNKITLASIGVNYFTGETFYSGIWNSLPYKYIGISVKIGEHFYYGWVMIEVRAGHGADFYIADCAVMKSHEGINDERRGNKYKIYPDPVHDKLTIEQESPGMGGALSLFNIDSQLLVTKEISNFKTELDLSSYRKGIYYMIIKNDREIVTRKIIKE